MRPIVPIDGYRKIHTFQNIHQKNRKVFFKKKRKGVFKERVSKMMNSLNVR